MAGDAELKQRILELLKSDEEFRLAVAGLLGLDTVINELKRLREDFQAFVKLEEKRWEEAFKRFESIERKLEERDKRLDRIIFKIRTLLKVMVAKFVYEDFVNNATRTGEVVISRRRNFKVDGHVIDLVIETARAVYIIDIESAPRRRHVDKLLTKAILAQKIFAKPVKPILVGVRVSSAVEEYARSKGVEILKY